MSLDFKVTGKHLDAMTDAELHELNLLIKMKRDQRQRAREASHQPNHSNSSHDNTPR